MNFYLTRFPSPVFHQQCSTPQTLDTTTLQTPISHPPLFHHLIFGGTKPADTQATQPLCCSLLKLNISLRAEEPLTDSVSLWSLPVQDPPWISHSVGFRITICESRSGMTSFLLRPSSHLRATLPLDYRRLGAPLILEQLCRRRFDAGRTEK